MNYYKVRFRRGKNEQKAKTMKIDEKEGGQVKTSGGMERGAGDESTKEGKREERRNGK